MSEIRRTVQFSDKSHQCVSNQEPKHLSTPNHDQIQRLPRHIVVDIATELLRDDKSFLADGKTVAKHLTAFAGQSKFVHSATLSAVALPHVTNLRSSVAQLGHLWCEQRGVSDDRPDVIVDLTNSIKSLHRLTALLSILPAQIGPLDKRDHDLVNPISSEPTDSTWANSDLGYAFMKHKRFTDHSVSDLARSAAVSVEVFAAGLSSALSESASVSRSVPPELPAAFMTLERAFIAPLTFWAAEEAKRNRSDCVEDAVHHIANAADGPPRFRQTFGSLGLYHTRFRTTPPFWHYVTNLVSLNLGRTDSAVFPKEIFNFRNLTDLRISGQQVSAIPSEISQLVNLETLFISDMNFQEVPREICKLSKLKNFTLSQSRITKLTENFHELENLENLTITKCPLIGFPPEILEMPGLRNLEVSYCGLTEIPLGIDKMKSLRTLYLRGNSLIELPDSIYDSPSLVGIWIEENRFAKKPDAVKNSKRLWFIL